MYRYSRTAAATRGRDVRVHLYEGVEGLVARRVRVREEWHGDARRHAAQARVST